MSVKNPNWRIQNKTWNDKMKYILAHHYKCDVAIRIKDGDKAWDYKAHQFVLNMSSDEFEKILQDHKMSVFDPGTKMLVLKLPETNSLVFGQFLNFLYTKNINLTSMYEAIEIYKLSEKFGTTELTETCRKYAFENVDNTNVLETIEFADKNNLTKLKSQCSELIKSNTLEVLKSSRWKLEWIEKVLDEPELNIKEIELFRIVESWVNTYYSDKENSGYRHVIWQAVIPRFCFLNMTADEFMEGPLKIGVITKDESLAVLGYIIKGDQSHLPYPSNFKKTKRSQYTGSYKAPATPKVHDKPTPEVHDKPTPEVHDEPTPEVNDKPTSIIKSENTTAKPDIDDSTIKPTKSVSISAQELQRKELSPEENNEAIPDTSTNAAKTPPKRNGPGVVDPLQIIRQAQYLNNEKYNNTGEKNRNLNKTDQEWEDQYEDNNDKNSNVYHVQTTSTDLDNKAEIENKKEETPEKSLVMNEKTRLVTKKEKLKNAKNAKNKRKNLSLIKQNK